MPIIKVEDKNIEIEDGANLRTSLISNGYQITSTCGGCASCRRRSPAGAGAAGAAQPGGTRAVAHGLRYERGTNRAPTLDVVNAGLPGRPPGGWAEVRSPALGRRVIPSASWPRLRSCHILGLRISLNK